MVLRRGVCAGLHMVGASAANQRVRRLLSALCRCPRRLRGHRKRVLWRAPQDGFKPVLPCVKRHMLHLTYSVPGSFALHWNHTEARAQTTTRCEVACVICARNDWADNRCSVYPWREATDKRTYTELLHTQSGTSSLLTRDDILCFGNRGLINDHLSVDGYMD